MKWIDIKQNNNNNKQYEQIFDFVIIASGIFSIPFMPPLFKQANNTGTFKGSIIHSGQYFSLQKLLQKNINLNKQKCINISIVGNSFSSYEIASDLISSAIKTNNINIKITNIITSPHWLLSRYQSFAGNHNRKIPLDLLFYLRDSNKTFPDEIKIKTQQQNIDSNTYLKDISLQNDIDFDIDDKKYNDILNDIDPKLPPKLAICDDYLEYFKKYKNDKIKLINGRITKLYDDKLDIVDNKTKKKYTIKCDILIIC